MTCAADRGVGYLSNQPGRGAPQSDNSGNVARNCSGLSRGSSRQCVAQFEPELSSVSVQPSFGTPLHFALVRCVHRLRARVYAQLAYLECCVTTSVYLYRKCGNYPAMEAARLARLTS